VQWLNLGNETFSMRVENVIDFRHSAVAHLYRSRGTLVCRGTQVGKHWFNI